MRCLNVYERKGRVCLAGDRGRVQEPLVGEGLGAFGGNGECDSVSRVNGLAKGLERDDRRVRICRAGMADEVLVGIAHQVAIRIVGSAQDEKRLVVRQVGHKEIGLAGVGTEQPRPVGEVQPHDDGA